VDALLEEPATILVVITLAVLLLVVEAALPTLGIAGTLAVLLSAVAVVAIDRQDATWWPLLGPAVAVVMWCVMVARRSRAPAGELVAVALFGGGSVAFGVMADSAVTALIGTLAAAGLAAVFPRLHDAAQRLLERPPKVGLDSLVGQTGEVVAWRGLSGTVRLQGSLWNARANQPFEVGDTVEVVSFSGMTLEVAPPSDLRAKEPTWKQ
jgi:membrane-bound ClpP family serine protease